MEWNGMDDNNRKNDYSDLYYVYTRQDSDNQAPGRALQMVRMVFFPLAEYQRGVQKLKFPLFNSIRSDK